MAAHDLSRQVIVAQPGTIKRRPIWAKKCSQGKKQSQTPPEGKRAAIPVTVQAAHNETNLYFRFQWEDTDHLPVPFIEGDKMDPDNQIKLALMLATDEVEYALQAGCWDTCHKDLRTMPGHPDDPAGSGLKLDLSKWSH